WGLKRSCAVAYTDKGTGTGAHDLARDEVGLLRGERVDADEAGGRSTFTAPISERQRQRFDARYPDRFAWKHAHSQTNPEARWGQHVLRSLDFAFFALNRELAAARAAGDAPLLDQDNTLVVASSVSNGGAASLRAAELARPGLIDGVVVTEPNVNPSRDRRFAIRQGQGSELHQHSRPLFDYLTLLNLYQGCANLAPANQTAPLNLTPRAFGENRCKSLRARGLLRATELAEQAEEAQRIINGYGILPEQNAVAPGYWASYVGQAVAVTYANAYAQASVLENLCGFSFAAVGTDPASPTLDRVIPLPESAAATLFATANGIPPTGGVAVVNNDAPGGAMRDQVSASRSTGRQDQNLDGHLCLRSLIAGRPTMALWAGSERYRRHRLADGIDRILASGRLRGTPAILVHGRADALIAPNHSSRPYYALSRLQDGSRSRISYVEVTHAQHLDAFNSLPGYDERFIPLHYYFVQAMDLMYAHLTEGDALPPSQVVRTLPRGRDAEGSVPPIELENLPPISLTPAEDARITFDGRTLAIPD
ncbi:3-hydroxybutyrate oligomer hydrolase family protein, partial [Geminicoccus flavidas]|uniref:3-hydroxybutyrate oligomer hydrolase family protein n=1 Tax=Geminicoccus flavidas TaxID=2506407 RepID=UPI001358C82F